MRAKHTVWLAALIFVLPRIAAAAPMITINVDFSNTSMLTTSDGQKITAAASGLTLQFKSIVLSQIKAKYEAVYGVGNVKVQMKAVGTGTGGADLSVVVTNTESPGGEAYGDAGAKGGPAIVYLKSFTANGFDAVDAATAAGETAAHELGHQLGLGHNDQANTLMSDGRNVLREQRALDGRSFTDAEAKKILENSNANGGIKKDIPRAVEKPTKDAAPGLGWNTGRNPNPPPVDPAPNPPVPGITGSGFNYDDDELWDSVVGFGNPGLLTAALDPTIGYINTDGEFFEVADPYDTFADGSTANTWDMDTFGSPTAAADMAIDVNGTIFDYSTYGDNISYSDLNPYNSALYLQADVGFNLPGYGFVDVNLDADSDVTGEPTTGGFFALPVPAPSPLLGAALLMLGAFALSRRSAHAN